MKKKFTLAVFGSVLAFAMFFSTCKLEVTPPIRLINVTSPYVSVQPQSYTFLTTGATGTIPGNVLNAAGTGYDTVNNDKTYFAFTDAPELGVELHGWRAEDGEISYQWFTFTDIKEYMKYIGDDETAKVAAKVDSIDGATEKTYTPTINGSTPGTYYHFVEVKNHFNPAPDVFADDDEYPLGSADGKKKTKMDKTIRSDVSIITISPGTGFLPPLITSAPRSAEYTLGRASSVSPLEVRVAMPVGKNQTTGADVVFNRHLSAGFEYQWYVATKADPSDAVAIVDAAGNPATDFRYMPDVASMKRGILYYYVEVQYVQKDGDTKSPVIQSIPISIKVLPAEKAQNPIITLQPVDQIKFTDDSFNALSVAAEPRETAATETSIIAGNPDGAVITYQWYTADKAAETGTFIDMDTPVTRIPVVYTKIEGATNQTYVPASLPEKIIRPTADGKSTTTEDLPASFTTETRYYAVEAINTVPETEVTGKNTASVMSKVVTVKSSLSGELDASDGIGTMPTITIQTPLNPANKLQYIRGYGGMDTAWANFPNTTEAETELQYNPDWGLGYNIMRIMVTPPGSNDPNYSTQAWIIDGLMGVRNDPQYGSGGGHRPDYIKNVKVVNKYGGYVLASPWTPPKEWKTNNSINSGGRLIKSYYKTYGDYLRSFAQEMLYRGAPIYAISIANEPNYSGGYDGCEWSEAEMRDFWIEVGRFTDGVRGYGGGKWLPNVLTMNGESANHPNINNMTLANPVSRAAVDLYARHVYGEQTSTLWASPYADWREGSAYQTECWMTEHNINSANPTAYPNDSKWRFVWRFMNDVDLVIRLNYENAFVWWASKRFYSMIGDNQYDTHHSQVLPRGWGLSHYAKYSNGFTRLGFSITGQIRNSSNAVVGITTGSSDSPVNASKFSLDDLSAKITAFVSPNNDEISLVMWTPTNTDTTGGYDMGNIKIKLPDGFVIDSAKAQRSTPASEVTGEYMKAEEVTIGSDRNTAYVSLPRSNILSVKFTGHW